MSADNCYRKQLRASKYVFEALGLVRKILGRQLSQSAWHSLGQTDGQKFLASCSQVAPQSCFFGRSRYVLVRSLLNAGSDLRDLCPGSHHIALVVRIVFEISKRGSQLISYCKVSALFGFGNRAGGSRLLSNFSWTAHLTIVSQKK
jgi:hypothetical protein